MIKVLQMAGLNIGGLETFIMNVYRKLDRSKIQFDFLTSTINGDYAPEIEKMGGKIFYLPSRHDGIIAYYRALDNFFKVHSSEYRAVHIHLSSLSHISDLFYPQKYGVKIRIVHSHSSSISANPLHYLLHYISKPFVRSLATNYLGCSDKALDWMYKYTGLRGEVLMIKNGIDAERFRYNMQQREALRERMGLTNMSIIGHVGRFMKVKNHAFLLSVFAYFHEFHPDSKLMLVGDGDLLDSIKALAVQLGISGDVLFLGKRTDIPDLLQVMDIVVMPSLFEGLPVSLVEAQASGLPVLATNIISSDTMISSGFHSMSLSQGPEAWAAKIDNILASYQRIDTYGDIKNKGFDISDTVAILENIYMGIK